MPKDELGSIRFSSLFFVVRGKKKGWRQTKKEGGEAAQTKILEGAMDVERTLPSSAPEGEAAHAGRVAVVGCRLYPE